MITSFDSLYAGHVDMENVGYAGTPVNERWFSDDHLATVFDKMTAMAQLMERTGYDTLWMAEHHFQREGYECLPNVLLTSLHLSHLTRRLRLGCAFNVAPMWHPLRLAEDFATVDRLTGGRVIFVWAGATIPARWRLSARLCWTSHPTANSSRSRSKSS